MGGHGSGPLTCLFVSDLHGRESRIVKLMDAILSKAPAAVFLGGDLTDSRPSSFAHAGPSLGRAPEGYIARVLAPRFEDLRGAMGPRYPDVFLILGNDDPRTEEAAVREAEERGLWHHAHMRAIPWRDFTVYGYACVPPTPFRLKDWERYDVSRSVEPGCISPEEGVRTVPVPEEEARLRTIAEDLEKLAGSNDLSRAIVLCHVPPYRTLLDRASLDGRKIDGVPVDVHIGSIAVERFIRARQPLVSLHGHVHESALLTGSWMDRIDRTVLFSAAHHGPELALVEFDPRDPRSATRSLI